MIIESRQRIRNLNDEIDIELNGNIINKIDSVKSLGVDIDSHPGQKDSFGYRSIKTYYILYSNEYGCPGLSCTNATSF
jgi:adenylate kinase